MVERLTFRPAMGHSTKVLSACAATLGQPCVQCWSLKRLVTAALPKLRAQGTRLQQVSPAPVGKKVTTAPRANKAPDMQLSDEELNLVHSSVQHIFDLWVILGFFYFKSYALPKKEQAARLGRPDLVFS